MTRLTIVRERITVTVEEADDRPSPDPIDVEGEEVSAVRQSPLRPGLAKATTRLAQVVPLFRKAAG